MSDEHLSFPRVPEFDNPEITAHMRVTRELIRRHYDSINSAAIQPIVSSSDLDDNGVIGGDDEFKHLLSSLSDTDVFRSFASILSDSCDVMATSDGANHIIQQTIDSFPGVLSEGMQNFINTQKSMAAIVEGTDPNQRDALIKQLAEIQNNALEGIMPQGSLETLSPADQLKMRQYMSDIGDYVIRRAISDMEAGPDLLQGAKDLPDNIEVTPLSTAEICETLTGRTPGQEL